MTVRHLPRVCDTFDVYLGPTMVGSVWRYGSQWIAFDRDNNMIGGEHQSRDGATARLLSRVRNEYRR